MRQTFIIILAGMLRGALAAGAENDVERQFTARYTAWTNYVYQSGAFLQATSRASIVTPTFSAIVELGPPALPFIAAKIEKGADYRGLSTAIFRIAKVKIESFYDDAANKVVFPEFPDLKPGEDVTVHWWKKGRFKTGERFAERRAEWRRLKAEGKTEEAEAAYQRIVSLGLPVLPYLAEAAEEEPDFVRAISKLTDGDLPPDAKPSECRSLWEKRKARFELPPLRDAGRREAKTAPPPK